LPSLVLQIFIQKYKLQYQVLLVIKTFQNCLNNRIQSYVLYISFIYISQLLLRTRYKKLYCRLKLVLLCTSNEIVGNIQGAESCNVIIVKFYK